MLWLKAGIRVKKQCNSVDKLKDLLKQWNNLYKSSYKENFATSLVHQTNKFILQDKMDDLFDIAQQSALEELDENIRNFLLNQRKKGRSGLLHFLNHISDDVIKQNNDNENNHHNINQWTAKQG